MLFALSPEELRQAVAGALAEVLRQVEPETESGPAYADPSTGNQQQMTADLISGDGQAGEALLDHAARQGQVTGQQGSDLLYRARVLAKQARLLIMRGEPGQARQLIGPALKLFEAEGSEQKAAAWAALRTSPTSRASTTRRCASTSKWCCRCVSG